jgi:anti-sigma regulatory factor (Ser/Thr protein kinase)
MDNGKKLALTVVLSPVLDLLPVVRLLVGRLAERMSLRESRRLNLQQGVAQVCGRAMERAGENGNPIRLQFSGYPDRLEVVVENKVKLNESESYLLNQLLDRVAFEESPNGRDRLTLVQYLNGAEKPS